MFKKLASDFIYGAVIIGILIGACYVSYNIGWNAHRDDEERRFKESAMIDISINNTTIALIKGGKTVLTEKFKDTDVLQVCWSTKPETWPVLIGSDTISLIDTAYQTDRNQAVISVRVSIEFTDAVRSAFRNSPAQGSIHL